MQNAPKNRKINSKDIQSTSLKSYIIFIERVDQRECVSKRRKPVETCYESGKVYSQKYINGNHCTCIQKHRRKAQKSIDCVA